MFSIRYEKSAEKFLEKLRDKKLQSRILDKIEKLKENPFPKEAKTIEVYGKAFRVRVGDYRVLYIVDHSINLIIIVEIDKRERIY